MTDQSATAIALQEQIAHLTRTVEELSDVVARQDVELAQLTRKVTLLVEREASRETGDGAVLLGDERPPHW